MINILISVNSRYLDKAETMLHSFRRNNSEEATVFLLNQSLNQAEIKRLSAYIQNRLHMAFVAVDVQTSAINQLPLRFNRFSIEIYFRVIAQFLLPESIDRVLWLDADIVVCGDVSAFYHQDFHGKLLAACPDAFYKEKSISRIKADLGLPEEHIYFNSGVLLLNIAALRKETELHKIIQTAQSSADRFVYPDQDLLNCLYTGKVKYCDLYEYNCQTLFYQDLTPEQIEKIAILHYAGNLKPWEFYSIHSLSKAAIPYWREVALQGKWFAVIKIVVLYALWLIYYKTGIYRIIRKVLLKQK